MTKLFMGKLNGKERHYVETDVYKLFWDYGDDWRTDEEYSTVTLYEKTRDDIELVFEFNVYSYIDIELKNRALSKFGFELTKEMI